MDREIEVFILDLLRQHSVLTLATVREDGWPQATTVGYVHDGLTLYVGCAAHSQKVRNIERCNKISLTVGHEQDHWSRIRALSMGATAEVVTDPVDIARATELILAKFPQVKCMPMPGPDSFAFLKIVPKVISILDYSKGFGHSVLVEV
jgi:general stress protein 26